MHARFYNRASQIVSTNPPLLELLANHLKCMCMGAGTCIVLFTLVTWRLEQCLSERVLNKTFLVESVNKSLMSINYIPNKVVIPLKFKYEA